VVCIVAAKELHKADKEAVYRFEYENLKVSDLGL
jgi:hypothetical protein